MTRLTPTLMIVALFGVALSAAPAQAQLARTYVSSSGSDLNNCDRLTPCRTFQHAHDQTLAEGEITVLDPGGYGSVTINRAISIINDGVGEAGVLVSGGATGIGIAAGATDAVSLRGLTVKGIGFGGGTGITFFNGGSLTIENCAVRSLDGTMGAGFGIVFAATNTSTLVVSNTVVTDNLLDGIIILSEGANIAVRAILNRVEARNNGGSGIVADGVFGTGTLDVTVVDSVAANNAGAGIDARSLTNAAVTKMMVVRSRAAYNQLGISASSASTTVRLTGSAVTGNAVGVSATSGTVLSYGDNQINANTGGETVPPPLGKK